jgi:hypothetical protein
VADGNTTTDQPDTGEQPPPPPENQIQLEIATGRVLEWIDGLFGTDDPDRAVGGGGTGGQFMFASIEELDGVITQWRNQLEEIRQDGRRIRDAAAFIAPPAGDSMSTKMADTTMQSLEALYKHNLEMRNYAEAYIQKLEASRASLVNTEEGGTETINSVQQGLG